MRVHPTTVYLDDATHVELRPSKDGRSFLQIVNDSDAEILYSEDIMATPENGVPVGVGASKEWGTRGASPEAVPQGTVWLLGTSANPARQKVIVREA